MKVQVAVEPDGAAEPARLAEPPRLGRARESGSGRSLRPAAAPAIAATRAKVGRNDPCPCGSGKKYKKCCGA
jgi:uncharacterized protein YecA (UPF0149 family)